MFREEVAEGESGFNPKDGCGLFGPSFLEWDPVLWWQDLLAAG